MLHFINSPKFETESSILLVENSQLKNRKFNFSYKKLADEIIGLNKTKLFSAERSQICPLTLNGKLILLVGLGKKDEISLTSIRIALRNALLSSYLKKVKNVQVVPNNDDGSTVNAVIEGVTIGGYVWKKYKSKDKKDNSSLNKQVTIVAPKKKVYDETIKISQGVNLSRDLINDNADIVTSDFIEKNLKDIVRQKKNISVEVLNQKDLKKKGLNLILAVNKGSNKDPKLIIAKYKGNPKSNDFTAIIGKGITFDSGGLNLKSVGHIETMRCDMGGAAAVLGILKNAISLNIKKNVLFVCAIAENAIGSGAYKPGDVVKSYSGKTVEIGNTDAEGRLVLADAISYVAKNYKPKKIIDLATLTGACITALGYDYTGLITPSDDLAKQIVKASKETDDRVWRLPIYDEIKDAMKSKVADVCNISRLSGAGTIKGAIFLQEFTGDIKWAHLDIAGTAFVENDGRMYFGHGATGAGVRLITNYLQNN